MPKSFSASAASSALLLLLSACHSKGASPELAPSDGAPPSVEPAIALEPAAAAPLTPALVASVVNPTNLPVYQGPTGSVEGTVYITGDPAPRSEGLEFGKCGEAREVYEFAFREGPPRENGDRPLADALIAITGYTGYYIAERNENYSVEFSHCTLGTRTIALTFGQKLSIANHDKGIVYAPELTQNPMPALMLIAPGADPISLLPRHPGYFTLIDKMGASPLSVDIYTLLQPLHAVTDVAGHYRIDGVPVGSLTVNTRLAAIQAEASRPVEVRAGVVSSVDLTLAYHPGDAGLPRRPAPRPKGPVIK